MADVELATILDRRIFLMPTLNLFWLSVVCPIIHLAHREDLSDKLHAYPSLLEHPLIIFHPTSLPLHKNHVPQNVGYAPKDVPSNESVPPSIHTPASTLFHVCVDVPTSMKREIDGIDVQWYITGSIPLMLLLNGLSPDDTSTILNELQIPRITKSC